MDVRCERCQTEYELEDSSVAEQGTEVQCTACGHTFEVSRPAPPPAPAEHEPPAADWLLETADGQSHRFRNLTSLQKWIIERKVTREDKISRTGHAWRRLGDIVELAPFFDVVDEADRARAAALAARDRPAAPAARATHAGAVSVNERSTPRAVAVPTSDALWAVGEGDLRPEYDTAVVRLRGSHLALKILVGLGVAAAVAYLGIRRPWVPLEQATTTAAGGAASPSDPIAAAPASPATPLAAPAQPGPGAAQAGGVVNAKPAVTDEPRDHAAGTGAGRASSEPASSHAGATEAPAAPMAPAGTGAPAAPVASAGTGAPAAAVAPAGTGAPAAPVASAGTGAPAAAVASAGTGAPAAAVAPAGTVAPAAPVAPVGTGAPAAPVAPAASGASAAIAARAAGPSAVTGPPPSYEQLIAQADRALENGATARAQKLYEQALAIRAGSPEALAGLGYVALDRNRIVVASTLFKRALAARPTFGPAIFGLAEAYRAAGDAGKALEHYRRYLSVDPGGTEAAAARRQIKLMEAQEGDGASP